VQVQDRLAGLVCWATR